jgi:hypothetical protein
VRFFYVYKSLAHPELNGYVQPVTIAERLMHIKEAKRTLGTRFEWLCDTMDNQLKQLLGGAPNCEYLIDPKGKVISARSWSNPEELRKDLAKFIGPVDHPTKVSDLKMKTEPPPKVAANGVVPRVELPSGLTALKTTAKVNATEEPFYVKLRAEAQGPVLNGGAGKLYLGFFLDPIYHVHWNNLVDPVRFEITASEGVKVTPARGEGPKVKEASDIDPREFLVDIEGASPGKTLELTVHYFGCNDEQGWCKPVTQSYTIAFERDRDAGQPMRNRRQMADGKAGAPGRGPGGPGGPPFDVNNPPPQVLQRFDEDRDGKLSEQELAAMRQEMQRRGPGGPGGPPNREEMMKRFDKDGDGQLNDAERAAMREAMQQGGGRPPNRRPQ